MNTFAAKDLEATDLLALARLDDDGAPCSGGPPHPQLARPIPDMIATAQRAHRPQPALGASRSARSIAFTVPS
jgi:hypothetical protein